MQRLPLSYIKPGMKTYEEVVDSQGRVLCGKGIEITEEMLKRFQELGVSYITVEGTPVRLPWERTLEEELELLEERFRDVKNDFALQIKEAVRELLLEKYGKERG